MREEASGDLGKPGERPMGIRKKTTAGTVTIAAKDSKAGTLTIREMGGKTKVLTFRDPKNVELLKPGDQVDVVYTETMAVMVEKAPKKNK
jgi:hypothetical protein